MMSSSSTDVVLVNEVKNCGILTLNKPKALNALNIDMVRYECIKKKYVGNEIIQYRLWMKQISVCKYEQMGIDQIVGDRKE